MMSLLVGVIRPAPPPYLHSDGGLRLIERETRSRFLSLIEGLEV